MLQVAIKFVSKESVHEFKVVSFTLHKFGQLNGTRYHDNAYTGKFGRGTGKPLGIFYYRTVVPEALDFTLLVLTISYLIQKTRLRSTMCPSLENKRLQIFFMS